MKKTIEIEMYLNATEVADEIWNWDCEEQAEFLSQLALLYKYNKADFLAQVQYVADELNNNPSVYNNDFIVKALEAVLDAIKGTGDAG